MAKNEKKTKNQPVERKPFFARFLEVQELKRISGGPTSTKYPSDSDETIKWPPR